MMQRNKPVLKNNVRYVIFLSFLMGQFFLFSLSPYSFARDVTFNWTANTDNPSADGYRLYYKLGTPGLTLNYYNGTNASNGNPSPIEIPSKSITSYTLQNLLDSEKYSFVLTAYRGAEESEPTNAIILDATTSPPTSLQARIYADTLNGETPLPVNFDATSSTGNIVKYEWTYGDGKTGTGSMTNHTFTSAGSYTTTLKVTDSGGATDQTTAPISVSSASVPNSPPTAVISSSSSVGITPFSVVFNGSSSTDNDGNISSYAWDFGDGGSSTGPQANHTYNTAGTFNAKLTVTDNGGLKDSTSTPVIVSEPAAASNKPPVAVIAASSGIGYAPLTVSFNGKQSYDTDGSIKGYIWSFGDGTSAYGPKVTHQFHQTATFKVTLKVRDNNGARSIPAIHVVKVVDKSQSQESESIKDYIRKPLSFIINFLLGSSSEEATSP